MKGRFGRPPLPWNPLPYMDEYIENLMIDEHPQSYVGMVKVGLSRFAAFCHTKDIKVPDEITRQHILHFQQHLTTVIGQSGEPLALSTRQQTMKYVRAWINWLHDIGHIENNPWVRIKVGSVAKKPKPLEDDEIAALFDAHRQQAFSVQPFRFHRREVILVLLYGWGLRIHELQALNVTNMDMRLDFVYAKNKGTAKPKPLPYSDAMKQVVQRYLIQRGRYSKIGEDALLIDSQGKRLSIVMIRQIVTELGARAGVTVNPHRLRDSFGTTMLDNDVEVERIMAMMGHRQRSQTLAYARLGDHKVKESHDRVMGPKLDELLGSKREAG